MIFLLEIPGAVDANGAARPVYVSTAPAFMTKPTEVPPNQPYPPRMLSAGSYERHCWQPRSTRGTSSVGFGVFRIDNSDGAYDWMITAPLAGKIVTVRRGPDVGNYPADYPAYATLVSRIAVPTSMREISLYVTDLWGLVGQKSLQPLKFAGTNALPNGLEGLPTDQQGKPKPNLFGTVVSFTPPCVNTSKWDFQLDDGTAKLPLTISGGSGPTRYGAFDKRSDLTYDGAQASLAAYLASTPAAGHFTTYAGPEGWYLRCGSQPTKLTVTASQGALSDRTVAQIVNHILTNQGGVAAANVLGVAALDALAPQEVGLWVGDETTIQPVLDSLLDSVNAYCVDTRQGQFQLGQLVDPATMTPVLTVESWPIKSADGVKIAGSNDPGVGILISAGVNGSQDRYLNDQDATAGQPCWRVKLLYDRNFTVMQGADVAGAAMADIAYTSLEYRAAIASNPAVQALYPLAPEFTCTTLLRSAADGAAEVSRQQTLRGTWRGTVDVPFDPYSPLDQTDPSKTITAADLGKCIRLVMRRFGWDAGKNFLVIGLIEDEGDERTPATTTPILWG